MSRIIPTFLSLIIFLGLAEVSLYAQTEDPTPVPDRGELPIPQIHTVQEGENLTIIAQTYGVSVAELQILNNLAEDGILSIGQTLIIPGGQGDAIATIYQVEVGDTLTGIAANFNTSVAALGATNHLIHRGYDL